MHKKKNRKETEHNFSQILKWDSIHSVQHCSSVTSSTDKHVQTIIYTGDSSMLKEKNDAPACCLNHILFLTSICNTLYHNVASCGQYLWQLTPVFQITTGLPANNKNHYRLSQ